MDWRALMPASEKRKPYDQIDHNDQNYPENTSSGHCGLSGHGVPVFPQDDRPNQDPEAIAEREAIQAYEAEQEAMLASDNDEVAKQ